MKAYYDQAIDCESNFLRKFSKSFISQYFQGICKEDRRNLYMRVIERYPNSERLEFEFCSKAVFPMSSRHYILCQDSQYGEKESIIFAYSIDRPEISTPLKSIRSDLILSGTVITVDEKDPSLIHATFISKQERKFKDNNGFV